ncbi:Uncharacterised protein [Vibrio cholerae]|nr:Uncharacterised protein [Vibrio cholerae]CSD11833.1 Uncharacterised protein [Vibrio cholerae]
MDLGARFDITAHRDNLLQHLLEVTRNGDFRNRVFNFTVFYPETSSAT